MPMIKKLHVPFRQKLGLGVIFAIGSLCVQSIVQPDEQKADRLI